MSKPIGFPSFMIIVTLCLLALIAGAGFLQSQQTGNLHKVSQLQKETIELQKEIIEALREQIKTLQGRLRHLEATRSVQVTVTAYTACPTETNNDPGRTASMVKPRPGIIAVSRDLFDAGWTFGSKVYLEGIGIYEIQDLMNQRFEKRLDVFIGSKKQAKQFGIKQTKALLLPNF
jgi:3D (Asp-Asp-Asp) domain-containing protein